MIEYPTQPANGLVWWSAWLPPRISLHLHFLMVHLHLLWHHLLLFTPLFVLHPRVVCIQYPALILIVAPSLNWGWEITYRRLNRHNTILCHVASPLTKWIILTIKLWGLLEMIATQSALDTMRDLDDMPRLEIVPKHLWDHPFDHLLPPSLWLLSIEDINWNSFVNSLHHGINKDLLKQLSLLSFWINNGRVAVRWDVGWWIWRWEWCWECVRVDHKLLRIIPQ